MSATMKKYVELSTSWATVQFGSVLFGAGLSTAVMMTAFGVLYIIPTFFAISFLMYGIAVGVQFFTYKMLKVNPSKENRWTMNSIIAIVYNTPWAILAGGCFAFLISVVMTVPLVVMSAFQMIPEVTEGSNYYILVVEHYTQALNAMNNGNGWEAIFYAFIYSKSIFIDVIRVVCQIVCLIGFSDPAKNRFNKQEFMSENTDLVLRYESGFNEQEFS